MDGYEPSLFSTSFKAFATPLYMFPIASKNPSGCPGGNFEDFNEKSDKYELPGFKICIGFPP